MKKIIAMTMCCFSCLLLFGQKNAMPKGSKETTQVAISIPDKPASINPMIYGQMFEDCNDQVIYGGIVGKNGEARPHIDEMLKPLRIPIMRWPAGTFIHEYHWERGIGPLDQRPVVEVTCWGGVENHRFGTDEFLRWCDKMGIESYINLNMANHPEGGTIEEALNWIEYTNGSQDTPYGKKRAKNGHPDPYGVRYWCIGNENWGSFGVHTKESAAEYADRLHQWASAIRKKHNDLKLLAVGHTYDWDKTVLEQNGTLIDILTQHYYVHTPVKNDSIVEPMNSLFAPAKMEAHLVKLGALLDEVNAGLGRQANPITLSIDEWNNRHQVFDGEQFKFTRNDLRRQFDVTVTAGMLNAFIRQCTTIGMANYIFPVNGHGLIRTVGDDDAFRTPLYYLFELYRKMMTGKRLDVAIDGPGVPASDLKLSIHGDASEMEPGNQNLPFIDGAAVLADDGSIHIAVINRSPDTPRVVKFSFPNNYIPIKKWEITHSDLNAYNSADDRDEIIPQEEALTPKRTSFNIPPCGWMLIRLKTK
jgi:alpha-N-arabinofuranosidase